jgi:starvation-inducible DNA-binding protein
MENQAPLTNADVAQKLAILLSDVVTAKFILHGYHWNVTGPDFGEFHEFFAMLYEDYDDSIDLLAENILKLGFPAPYLLTDFIEMSCIREERLDGLSSRALLESALRVNSQVIEGHYSTFAVANDANKQGLTDFLAGRIDTLEKWNWQIKAFLGVR